MLTSIHDHLISRQCDISRYTVDIDEENRCARFFLWNLSGQLCGYQKYQPDKDKTQNNDPIDGRYYTRPFGRQHHDNFRRDTFLLTVFGLETFNYRSDILFVVEGIFDACPLHNRGLPCIAVLGSTPKQLKPWFRCISNRKLIALTDGDMAGSKLGKLCDISIACAPGEDPNSMSKAQLDQLLKEWV